MVNLHLYYTSIIWSLTTVFQKHTTKMSGVLIKWSVVPPPRVRTSHCSICVPILNRPSLSLKIGLFLFFLLSYSLIRTKYLIGVQSTLWRRIKYVPSIPSGKPTGPFFLRALDIVSNKYLDNTSMLDC